MAAPVPRQRLVGGPYARCLDCGRDYPSTESADYGLCPTCEASEQAEYVAAYASDAVDEPRRWSSKAVMRERLGVTGDEDE